MDPGPSTSETLLIALAGGAIGAVLTGIAWVLIRLASVPSELAQHDFEVQFLNQDLELWAADDYRRVKRELTKSEISKANKGQLYAGSYGNARAAIKSNALHRWRDRLHETERRLLEIASSEGLRHRAVRRVGRKHRQGLQLTAPERVAPIIDELRQPVTKHGQPRVQVFDPTRFKLSDLLEGIKRKPLEPAVPPEVEVESDGGGGWTTTVRNEPERETPDVPGLGGPIDT